MTNYLRSDEMASNSEIERARVRDKNLKSGVKTAASLGVAAGGLTGLSSKILPFLSEHIPADLAIKGISKLSPSVGSFLKKGMSKGLNFKDGLDFIKEQIQSSKKEPAKESKNVVQQYSPELHEFMSAEIGKGRSPIEAGAIAQHDKRFSEAIGKMSKDHKTPWSSILQGIYGSETQGKGQPQQPQQMEQQQSQQPQQPQQGGGQGQQALMAILQKLQQSRGAR